MLFNCGVLASWVVAVYPEVKHCNECGNVRFHVSHKYMKQVGAAFSGQRQLHNIYLYNPKCVKTIRTGFVCFLLSTNYSSIFSVEDHCRSRRIPIMSSRVLLTHLSVVCHLIMGEGLIIFTVSMIESVSISYNIL